MNKKQLLCVMVGILTYSATTKSSSRFFQTAKKISASKIFNYGGGIALTGASLYYIDQKINALNAKERIKAELSKNPVVLRQINDIVKKGSEVIFCDTYAPIKIIAENKVARALYDAILTERTGRESTRILQENIKQLTIETTKKIAHQSLKYFHLDSPEKQKFICVFSAFMATFVMTQAVASVWKNMRAGQLFFRSSLVLSSTITGATLLSEMLFDEERIVSLAAYMFHKNQSVIMPVFEQLAYETKEFSLESLRKRDALLLLLFKKSAFDRAMNKLTPLPFENIDELIHHPMFQEILATFSDEVIELLYQYTQSGGLGGKMIGRIVLGTRESSFRNFLSMASEYIQQLKEEGTPLLGTRQMHEPLEFSYEPGLFDMLYDFFFKKEMDESCEESPVIVEEVAEEQVD